MASREAEGRPYDSDTSWAKRQRTIESSDVHNKKMAQADHAVRFKLELFPETAVYMALFKDVTNVNQVKKHIVSGDIDAALLSAKMVLHPFQVLIAVNKTVHLKKHQLKMNTRNVNSEVLYNLSPSKNISESFRWFGFSEGDAGVVVVTLDDDSRDKMTTIEGVIQGEAVPLDEIRTCTDESLIKQVYKVQEEELSVCSLLDAVVFRMAAKDVL